MRQCPCAFELLQPKCSLHLYLTGRVHLIINVTSAHAGNCNLINLLLNHLQNPSLKMACKNKYPVMTEHLPKQPDCGPLLAWGKP